jgi:hypothetical protein
MGYLATDIHARFNIDFVSTKKDIFLLSGTSGKQFTFV